MSRTHALKFLIRVLRRSAQDTNKDNQAIARRRAFTLTLPVGKGAIDLGYRSLESCSSLSSLCLSVACCAANFAIVRPAEPSRNPPFKM